MATAPIFTATPRCAVGQIGTANTNRDGTGTVGTICSAGTNGSRIDYIEVQATGTTTAGVVRLFIHDNTNFRLLTEIMISAITPSTTVAAAHYTYTPAFPIILPANYSIRASTHNAETFNIFCWGGDF